jgi:hypothetical protein
MTRRFRALQNTAFFGLASLCACGGSGSSLGSSPAGSPSPTPGPTATQVPAAPPTAMPTSAGNVPTTACHVLAEPLPATYTSITTFGTVSGSTYTQYPGAGSGAWQAITYAAPSPGPSAEPTTTPVPAPTPTPVNYIEYSGTYKVPGFSGAGVNGPYTTGTTTGCFLLVATQDGEPVAPGDAYNSYAIGFPGFSSATGVTQTNLASGNITSFTVTNLSPFSGDATFVLDSDAIGTAKITGSSYVTFARARRL